MSYERDELAELYADILFRRHGIITSQSKEAADELIREGYRKPRTVTTAEELDALPVGSVVLDDDGDAWKLHHRMERPDKTWHTYWTMADFSDNLDGSETLAEYLPATVLHEARP